MASMTFVQCIRIFAVLIIVSLPGCAIHYRSPGLSAIADPSEIAIVEPEKYEIGAPFFISKIDGEGKGFGMISRIELAPGRQSGRPTRR
jgi:hypothetical protein